MTASGSTSRGPRRDYLNTIYERGLEHCRNGEWNEGLVDLAWLAEGKWRQELPGLCYSYLGYGVAKYRNQIDNGIRLCRHAVKIEFYQPENYLNLARTYLLKSKYRREAFEAVRDGLKVDPDHPELLELHRSLGMRKPPVLPFLSRHNLINRICGWFRHQFRKAPKGEPEADSNSSSGPGVVVNSVA